MELFWKKVSKTDACWLWIGHVSDNGYAKFGWQTIADRKMHGATVHRVAWSSVNGDIPDGMQIDHLCRVRNCVRPDHLEVVTPRENTARSSAISAKNMAKTTCPRGHPYSGVNIDGKRICHECARNWMHGQLVRRNAAAGKETQLHSSQKTHCPRGHEYSGMRIGKRGTYRVCGICDLAKVKAYQARKKAEREAVH